MSCTVVISQPMFIPWVGLFEQLKLADFFVHYDDVQLPQGRSFMSRVEIKGPSGPIWLSAPIDRRSSGKTINDTYLVGDSDWRDRHLRTLQHCYGKAPFFKTMFEMADAIYGYPSNNLASFNRHAIELIAGRLHLTPTFVASSDLGIGGSSTLRLVNICRHLGADSYVTGLGALNYLDYSQFEDRGISVRYMDYMKVKYPQLHGEFTPYVSILDAVANCGSGASKLICSTSTYWKEFNVEQN